MDESSNNLDGILDREVEPGGSADYRRGEKCIVKWDAKDALKPRATAMMALRRVKKMILHAGMSTVPLPVAYYSERSTFGGRRESENETYTAPNADCERADEENEIPPLRYFGVFLHDCKVHHEISSHAMEGKQGRASPL